MRPWNVGCLNWIRQHRLLHHIALHNCCALYLQSEPQHSINNNVKKKSVQTHNIDTCYFPHEKTNHPKRTVQQTLYFDLKLRYSHLTRLMRTPFCVVSSLEPEEPPPFMQPLFRARLDVGAPFNQCSSLCLFERDRSNLFTLHQVNKFVCISRKKCSSQSEIQRKATNLRC